MTYGSRSRLASVYLKFINLGEKEEKEREEGEGHVAAGTSSMADLVFQLAVGRNRARRLVSAHISLFERSFGGNIRLILAKAM